MRIMSRAVLAIVVLMFAACGGGSSSGSSTAKEAADKSIEGMGNIMDGLGDLSTCTPSGGSLVCNCSGGGTVVFTGDLPAALVTKGTAVATASSCKDSTSGLTYTGTLNVNTDTEVATVNFTQFGECVNVTGTASIGGEACSGTISGTCAGESISCSLSEDASGTCVCS